MKKTILVLLTICVVLAACSKDKDSTPDSPFKGEWTGVFNGDDSGSWEAIISTNGDITATTYSEEYGNYTAKGKVSPEGDVTLTFGTVSTGATFTGVFSETSAKGKWVNSSGDYEITGNWRGYKDGTFQSDGLSNNIHNLLSDENIKAIKNLGFPIYGGDNPPNFENIYLVSPVILKSSTVYGDDEGDSFADMKIQYYNQSNKNLTVNVEYIQGDGIEEGIGEGSFISGTNNELTVFTKLDIYNDGSKATGLMAFSGRLVNDGINNFHFAILMIDDYGDPNDVWIEENTGRLLYDEDGFSEIINSLKKGEFENGSLNISKLFRSN